MPQRSEIFTLKNIALIGLLLTVLYGTYSYNDLKGRLNVSHANFLTVRSEVAQGSNQLKAALKGRMSCMKDLKQMRTTMWELRSKMSELETESNKQKHENEAKLIEMKKETDSCKTNYENLQKDFVKLKEDDKAKLVKGREDEEENTKKLRKLSTEHELAVSKLNDQVQDLKTENEKLRVALAAAKRKIDKSDGAPAVSDSQSKRASADDTPRQVQPPGLPRKQEKIADNATTTAVKEMKASNTSVVNVLTKSTTLESTKDTVRVSSSKKNTTAQKDEISTSGVKTRTTVTKIPQTQVKDSDSAAKSIDKGIENKDTSYKKKQEKLEDKVDESKPSAEKSKSLKFDSQSLDKRAAVIPPPGEKSEDKKADVKADGKSEDGKVDRKSEDNKAVEKNVEGRKAEDSMESNKVLRAPNLQAALEKMKRARASLVKEESQPQQVDLPPKAGGQKMEKIDNQLPQPIREKSARRDFAGSDTEGRAI